MGVCQIEEKDAGRSYPRTCPTCGLRGGCAKGLDRKGLLARIEALEAEKDAAVLAEREACAAVCEEAKPAYDGHRDPDRADREEAACDALSRAADGIRARSNTTPDR